MLVATAGFPLRSSSAAPVRDRVAAVARSAAKAARPTIVIGDGAAFRGYQTRKVSMRRGVALRVTNHDHMAHTVTSRAHNANGAPLFDTTVGAGRTVTVAGASKIAAGRYAFYCRFHPSMRGTLVVTGKPGGTTGSSTQFAQPLVVPRQLTGSSIRIPVRTANVRVLPHGPTTPMWTYGGTFPGPTIRRPAGHVTKVRFDNQLPKSTGSITVHLHGDHHSSANDGQPDSDLIAPGHSRTYDYPLTDDGRPERGGFDFYHDHRMGFTARNNWYGLQGMFIIDDPAERKFDLPSGHYDVPLMVSDRTFTSKNRLTDPYKGDTGSMSMTGASAPPDDGVAGNRILVNGRYAPYLKVSTHLYRFRLVNTSGYQSYDFELSDHRSFRQIGTGDGLLPRAVDRRDLLLGPAQRADVVVSFRNELHRNVVLESVPRVSRPKKGIGTPRAQIMQFRVTRSVRDTSKAPTKLEPAPRITVPTKSAQTWSFDLGGNKSSGTYWTINGKTFDPRRVDYEVPLGSTQLWTLRNRSNVTHYIHLHEEQWHTVRRDGKTPPPWERGLEDTWRLDPGESVEVAARFTDYTGVFMIHCHMLDHEDHGMMAQFAVVKPGDAALPKGYYYSPAGSSSFRTGAGAMTAGHMTKSDMAAMPMPATAAAGAASSRPAWIDALSRVGRAAGIEVLLAVLVIAGLRLRRRRRS
jgi:spore coat protein A